MKITKLWALALLLGFFTFSACTSAPDAKEAVTTKAKEVKESVQSKANSAATKVNRKKGGLNIEESKIAFIGTKPTGRHSGEFKIQDGALDIVDGVLKGGKFIIDMNSLTVTDLEGEMKANLEGHLKSDDFFGVEKHPKASFVITDVVKSEGEGTHVIGGNLTMLGKTNNIKFPASINTTDGIMRAEANFNIDRTKWNIRYGNDKSLGDKFIRPEVNINVNLVSR